MNIYYCDNKCCKIKIKSYVKNFKFFNRNYKKAGIFIFDPKTDKVLLVQSRGHLWGPPKGTANIGEHFKLCAVRETEEETGIKINPEKLNRYVKINNKAVYYYLEMDECEINIQNKIKDNDANGITWIKLNCLEKSIMNGNIVLNHYAKIVFKKFLYTKFKNSSWTMVKYKK